METHRNYVLGAAANERQRLALQHRLWQPLAEAGWRRAGLREGSSVLDLGCGPGFAAVDLARLVGRQGRVLGLESNADFRDHARQLAQEADLPQLEIRAHDLCGDPLPLQGFDLAWCRWVAMFLPVLEPLLAQIEVAVRPGGAVLFHEYVNWRSFGLHPHGSALAQFAEVVLHTFLARGGDPDVNRRLPSLLAARGWRIEALQALPALGGPDSWVADWLEAFVLVQGERLRHQGIWSGEAAAAVAEELAAARCDPGSVWVGPTVLELRARRL